MTKPPLPTQPPPMQDHLFAPGESLLQTWQPHLLIFLRKLLWVGFLTTVFLGSGSLFLGWGILKTLLVWLATLPAAMAFYIFIFGDYEEWFRRRGERWVLTTQRLIFFGPDSGPEPISVPLTDIKSIGNWMWWTLRLNRGNGQRMTLDYLPNRAEIKTSILAARDKAKGNDHG